MASILNATTTSGLVTSADNSGSLQLQTNNGTTAVTIDTSQNVGIGTTTPATKLTVASGGKGRFYRADNTRYGDIYTDNDALKIESSTDPIVINAATGQGTRFQDAGTERMRITGDGNLLVGKTTTSFSTQGANIQNDGALLIAKTHNDSGGAQLYLNRLNVNGPAVYFYKDTSNVGNISVTGSATSYNSGSDYRLKDNIQPLTNALDKVAQLKPSTWAWKIDGSYGDGFIAHELAEVCPNAVTGEKDAVNEDGSIRPQGVDTSFLVATLTAAIQELKAELDATKAEVQALKGVA